MDRDAIIRRVETLTREQLEQLRLFLDRLQGHPENQTPAPQPDPAETESD